MALITPDISQLFGPAGAPNGVGETIPPDMLAELIQQQVQQTQPMQQPQLPPELVQALTQRLGQGESQGWNGPTMLPPPGAPPLDPASMRTVGNTSGYAGPLRPSDVPMSQVQPVMAPEKAQAADEMQRLRNQNIPGIGNAGQMLDLSQIIQHLPKEVQAAIMQAHSPQLGIPGPRSEKEVNYIRSHAKDFYNKETGEPAGSSDVLSERMDPAEFRRTHMELNQTQKQNVDAIGTLDQQIELYKTLREDLGRTAGPGMHNTVQNYLATKYGRLSNDPNIATLDAARAQITQIARAFGGDSRVSAPELALLNGAVISDSDNQQSINNKLKVLQDLRDKKAQRVGVPWLQQRKEQPGSTAPAQATSAQPQAQGLQQGYVPMLNAQGQPVQVRAALVQQKLQQGYRPFQQ